MLGEGKTKMNKVKWVSKARLKLFAGTLKQVELSFNKWMLGSKRTIVNSSVYASKEGIVLAVFYTEEVTI